MLACISLKEKKQNALAVRKKESRRCCPPPFLYCSYIGISSSAFEQSFRFLKNQNIFFCFSLFLAGSPVSVTIRGWTLFQGVYRHCPTLIIRDGQALDAVYLRNGLMPARIPKWKDNKRFIYLFFAKLLACKQPLNCLNGGGICLVCFSFFSLSQENNPFPTVSIARTVIIGTNGQLNWRWVGAKSGD